MTVRISAVRAIRGFCEHLRSPVLPPPVATATDEGANGDEEEQRRQQMLRRSSSTEYRAGLLSPVLPAALDALVAMSGAFAQSSDMLGLVLENMAVVLAVRSATFCSRFLESHLTLGLYLLSGVVYVQ